MSSRHIADRGHEVRAAWTAVLLAILLAAAGADPVIAERGQDQITVSQARALIAAAPPDLRRKLTTDPAVLKAFLRDVLVQRAILTQALAEKWDQKPDIVALVARAKAQVVAQSFLESHAVPPPSYPSEAELQAAYTQNKAQFMEPRGYHLTQIFTPKPAAGASDDGKTKLGTLRTQIEHGRVQFADGAKRVAGAQYLDMGWTNEKQLVPAVKDAVSGLLEGGIAGPVCTENGCHLLRLVATKPAGPTPLLELREGLIRALRQQKQTELERAYASSLLAKQPAEINEIELSRMAP